MTLRWDFQAIRLIVVGILMSVAVLIPQFNQSTHNPIFSLDVGIERHLELDSTSSVDSHHSHHNGTLEESSTLHQHGHNSADHTHLSLNLCSEVIAPILCDGFVSADYNRSHLSALPDRLQRPPRTNHFA